MVRSKRFIGNWKNHTDNQDEEYVNNSLVGTWSTGAPNLTVASGLTVSAGSVTVPAGSIGAADIADDSLTGDQVATVADDNTEGGIPLIYRIDVAALTASQTSSATDVTVVDKIRVIDVHAVMTVAGVATDNMAVYSTGGAITDDISWSGADKAIVRAATIDDAQHEIDGAILRVVIDTSATNASAGAGTVYVTAIKVA